MVPRNAEVSGNKNAGIIGLTIDHLQITSRIGSGGIGDVYLANDLSLDRPVAIKVLNARMSDDPAQVLRFQREARACARLDHPNVVRVWQVGRFDGGQGPVRYMVMEFVEGQNLDQAMKARHGAFSLAESARIGLAVAKALRHAHARNIIHRDIKPANILLRREDNEVKVVDFGLARLLELEDGTANPAHHGTILGTPNYLSPEQARGLAVDGRTDVYALGITLYEMLAGVTPFSGASIFTVIHSHIFEPIIFPLSAFGKIDPAITELIQRMCHKEMHERPTAAEVVSALEAITGQASGRSQNRKNTTSRMHATPLQPSNSFVGRRQDAKDVCAALTGEEFRVATIVGPAGVGKTRLAQEVCEEIAKALGARAVRVVLGAEPDYQTLCRSFALGLGMDLHAEDNREQLLGGLELSGPLLMLVDNAERTLPLLALLLQEICECAPDVRFLVSSREPVRIEEERVIRLRPLATGGSDNPAVTLFIDRARAASPSFALKAGEMQDVLAIVKDLDGIPLAIELAAARIATLSPAQIRARLAQRFEILRSAKRSETAPLPTMEEAIGWSWEMLDADQQLTLAQISIFEDGFFLDDAERILDLRACPNAAFTLDIVEGLAERSLLQSEEIAAIPGELRFKLLATIRDYAALRLIDGQGTRDLPATAFGADAQQALRARHAECYLERAKTLAAQIYSFHGHVAAARLDHDVSNIEAAHSYFLSQRDFANAAELALILEDYWQASGPWKRRLTILDQTLAIGPPTPTLQTFDLTLARAHISVDRRDAEAICAAHREATALAARSGGLDQGRAADLAIIGAEALRIGGKLEAAQAALLDLRGEPSDEQRSNSEYMRRVARIERLLGLIAHRQGDYELAISNFLSAEEHYNQFGDRYHAVANLDNRGMALLERGEVALGLECLELGLKEIRLFSMKRSEGLSLNNLAAGNLLIGDYDKAIHYGKRAEAIFRTIGDAAHVATILINLGTAYTAVDDFESASEACTMAANLGRALNAPDTVANASYAQGSACLASRRFGAAEAAFEEAAEIWRAQGYHVGVGASEISKATLRIFAGDFAAALELLASAGQQMQAANSGTGAFELAFWRAVSELRLENREAASADLKQAEAALGAAGEAEPRPFQLAALHALLNKDSEAEAEAEVHLAILQAKPISLRPEVTLLAGWLGLRA